MSYALETAENLQFKHLISLLVPLDFLSIRSPRNTLIKNRSTYF